MTIKLNHINPWYISGLTQADGSFFCVVTKKTNAKFGLVFRPTYTLTRDLNSINILTLVQNYFGCGNIKVNTLTHSAELVITKKSDLIEIIIPHFLAYP